MKFNKWTLGLAAVGAISLVPAARADEKPSALATAFNNTTISGYVSASMNWAIAPGGGQNGYSPANAIPFQSGKQDGFNLDVLKIAISKPEDESPWASGYNLELLFGPDATGYNPSANAYNSYYSYYYGSGYSDFSIKQAYVTLRTPVGNGIDWKIGVFDTVIGYEVTDAGSNPNYTRSIGYAVEPTEHTGFLGTYKINDQWSVSAGVANTLSAGINARDMESGYHAYYYYGSGGGAGSDWKKTLMGSIVYTAPMSWGWAAGSSIYVGAVYGFATGSGHYGAQSGYQQNYYFGATVNTPWKQLTTGVAFDYVRNNGGGNESGSFFDNYQDITDVYVIGVYATYKATDKLSFNGRAEYAHSDFTQAASNNSEESAYESMNDAEEITATVEYDLWANVVSRVELRYDHDNSYRGDSDHEDSLGFYANVIYKW
jgi:hypothetical protein